ncbi:DUF6777 domain-containing protein [Streptomyces sp. NPDC014870]|uniref:DUF6777 domain-containing protein n=1 Tax=Streptomyces sp. NPDC014870 TaxID=3364925 RepID=UPI0036FE18FF
MGAERKKGKNVTSHPSSGRPSVPPAGPPSGPLSGPSTSPGQAGPPPPPGPPHDGSGGGSGGSGGPGGGGGTGRGPGDGGGPWWRSVPKVASVTAVLVAAVALVVVLTRPDGNGGDTGGSGGEVFLQNAAATGPDPFTKSTARTTNASQSPAPLPSPTRSADATATRSVSGAAPGLYGGTQSTASCDVEQQVRYLADEPAKNAAFAQVQGISPGEVPGYLRSLTPLQLRVDTRVTNHGFRDGGPTAYQAVLQAGTAVLVDDRGVPRVRCACGNPLTPPVAQQDFKTTGTKWAGYQPSQVVVVAPSVTVVNVFVVYDPEDDDWFARKPGDTGKQDKPTKPPTAPPSPSVSGSVTESPSSQSPSSPVPCVTVTGTDTPTPKDGVTPPACPSDSPSSSSPASESPESPASPESPVSPESVSPQSEPATGDSTADGTPTNGTPSNGTTERSASVSPQSADISESTSGPAPQSGPGAADVVLADARPAS